MKIRTLGHSLNFLPQTYPQLLWITSGCSHGACGDLRFAIYYAPFSHSMSAPESMTMKAEIHPNYADIKVTCSCGNEFTTRSTLGEDLLIEVCSSCHPFYTGKQKIVDTGGRVDKFRRKYGIN